MISAQCDTRRYDFLVPLVGMWMFFFIFDDCIMCYKKLSTKTASWIWYTIFQKKRKKYLEFFSAKFKISIGGSNSKLSLFEISFKKIIIISSYWSEGLIFGSVLPHTYAHASISENIFHALMNLRFHWSIQWIVFMFLYLHRWYYDWFGKGQSVIVLCVSLCAMGARNSNEGMRTRRNLLSKERKKY